METGPRFTVSSETLKKQGIDLAIPGLVVKRVCPTTPTPLLALSVKQS